MIIPWQAIAGVAINKYDARPLSDMFRRRATPKPAESIPSHPTLCESVTKPGLSRILIDWTLWNIFLLAGEPARRILLLPVYTSTLASSLSVEAARKAITLIGILAATQRIANPMVVGHPLDLRRWQILLGVLATVYSSRRGMKAWKDAVDPNARRKRILRAEMEAAPTYEEWALAATRLDQLEGHGEKEQATRWQREIRLYDRQLLKDRVRDLRQVRQNGKLGEMIFAVRADLLRNLGNMTNSELHENFPIVPEPIRDYIDEVKLHIQHIADAESLDIQTRLDFLRETRHAFGRTALVLSGGGALGAFHIGVVKALFDEGLLPRVLAGSSAGAIVAATTATRSDAELREMFDHADEVDLSFFANRTPGEFFSHFVLKGTLQDSDILQRGLKRLLGDCTFLQAYQHSGRVLNVSVCPADTNEPPRVLNYLTAPHVLVWSAVACSSAFPLLFLPQKLYARNAQGEQVEFTAESMRETDRRWRDGSLEEDLPMKVLGEMFGVNYFLVSQTNPHIIPFMNFKKNWMPKKLGNLVETEWKHRCRQLIDLFPNLKLAKVVCQPWEGDITMLLPSTWRDLTKSILDPSKDELKEACRQGELATFQKLSAIQANCAIERTLDACMAKLTEQVVQERKLRVRPARGVYRSRIPSWLHLPALGMPSIPSDDSLDSRVSIVEEGRGANFQGMPSVSSLERLESLREGEVASFVAKVPRTSFDIEASASSAPADADFAMQGVLDEYITGELLMADCMPFDCTDRSVNIWDALDFTHATESVRPAAFHRVATVGHGLDVIAP
eukprot:jgi/Botrbrau1/7081/Bobra.0165s0103.1